MNVLEEENFLVEVIQENTVTKLHWFYSSKTFDLFLSLYLL